MPRSSRAPVSLAAIRDVARAVPAMQDRIVYEVSVVDVAPSPRNPRHKVDGLDELAESIRAHGLLQPIIVRPLVHGYELVAGHRRLAAVQQLGWVRIPAVVRQAGDNEAYILTLVENLQREDLTPKEEAAALEVLMREYHWTTRQVGDAIKRSHIYVSRRLRVFEDEVLAGPVLADELPVSTAEELLRADPDARPQLAERAIAENWGQADARRAVASWNVTFQGGQPSPRLASRIRALREELAGLDVASLPARTRRELARLIDLVSS